MPVERGAGARRIWAGTVRRNPHRLCYTGCHQLRRVAPTQTRENRGKVWPRPRAFAGCRRETRPESSSSSLLLLLLSYESVRRGELGSTCSRHNHTVSLAANQKPSPRPLRQANGHDNCLNQNTRTGDSGPAPPGLIGRQGTCPEVPQPFTGCSSLPLAGTKKEKKSKKPVDRPQGDYLLQRHTWRVHGGKDKARTVFVSVVEAETDK